MINQIEHTPLMHDEDLLSFCKENNIITMAWGAIIKRKHGKSKNKRNSTKI